MKKTEELKPGTCNQNPKYSILFITALIITLTLLACEDTATTTPEAVLMSRSDLKATIGYQWIDAYGNLYNPDTLIINQIKQSYNPDIHTFYLFLQPSCTCRDLTKEPAYLIKVFDRANIPEENYFIYSMGSTETNHPFEDRITISSLPSVYVCRADQFVYSIIDTFFYYSDRSQFKPVEEILLDAITNY
jgi:hypothetical protein